MSEDVSRFLEQVRELGDRRVEEDEARSRELEEKILADRKERQARRAGTTRNLYLDIPLLVLFGLVARTQPLIVSQKTEQCSAYRTCTFGCHWNFPGCAKYLTLSKIRVFVYLLLLSAQGVDARLLIFWLYRTRQVDFTPEVLTSKHTTTTNKPRVDAGLQTADLGIFARPRPSCKPEISRRLTTTRRRNGYSRLLFCFSLQGK